MAIRFVRIALLLVVAASPSRAVERVRIDDQGVIRWTADDREVALFGANYCLPSASDYRAAGYVGSDRKKLIERDVTHFARMGWDGLRVCLWGDWENSDREGNLIVNDHLDLMDYLIFQASQRGISILFTPITRHSALWPDASQEEINATRGFSKFYSPAELGTHPGATAAQQNYLKQILNHVNPYTGIPLKDEPAIVFIELINEPEHHAEDAAGSIAYIDALIAAIRSTGCEKILFHNLSQDFRMGPILARTKVQGYTFAWYPTGLLAGRTLTENYLRTVDHFTPLIGDRGPKMPRIVYEFDSADMTSAYMYPAMVRSFREVGAQFAAMFAYDMLDTAPFNAGWQTHFLNLVYSPRKAVSAIIAAEALRVLPRGVGYGSYPENQRFEPVRVDPESDLSELVTAETFMNAGDTSTPAPSNLSLKKVVGCGSSPLVTYEGLGSYHLDKIREGIWRLELYPDAIWIQDPFAQKSNYRTPSARLIWHTWPMVVHIDDLGGDFAVTPIDHDNTHRDVAQNGQFQIRPGVYLLSRQQQFDRSSLPGQIGALRMDEFVCPPASNVPLQIVSRLPAEILGDLSNHVSVEIATDRPITSATLEIAAARKPERVQRFPLVREHAYTWRATLPADALDAGIYTASVSVSDGTGFKQFPESEASSNGWTIKCVSPHAPLILFSAENDTRSGFAMRVSGDSQAAYYRQIAASADAPSFLQINAPAASDSATPLHALSFPIKRRVSERGASIANLKTLRVTLRGTASHLRVALVESDGTTWSKTLAVTNSWTPVDVSLSELELSEGVMLPLGYPGNWNFRLTTPANRGGTNDALLLAQVEHLQMTVPESAGGGGEAAAVEIQAVELISDSSSMPVSSRSAP